MYRPEAYPQHTNNTHTHTLTKPHDVHVMTEKPTHPKFNSPGGQRKTAFNDLLEQLNLHLKRHRAGEVEAGARYQNPPHFAAEGMAGSARCERTAFR